MTLYIDQINTKMTAIAAKDATQIQADGVHIPYRGTVYTVEELQDWLDYAYDFLNIAIVDGETAFTTQKDLLYSYLSNDGKGLADVILAGSNDYTLDSLPDPDDYPELRCMVLYTFATMP